MGPHPMAFPFGLFGGRAFLKASAPGAFIRWPSSSHCKESASLPYRKEGAPLRPPSHESDWPPIVQPKAFHHLKAFYHPTRPMGLARSWPCHTSGAGLALVRGRPAEPLPDRSRPGLVRLGPVGAGLARSGLLPLGPPFGPSLLVPSRSLPPGPVSPSLLFPVSFPLARSGLFPLARPSHLSISPLLFIHASLPASLPLSMPVFFGLLITSPLPSRAHSPRLPEKHRGSPA